VTGAHRGHSAPCPYTVRGKGVGSALLKDALLRTAQAADTIGARALLVHAKDDNARLFYEHFNFEQSPSDPYHLLLIMKDIPRRMRLSSSTRRDRRSRY